VSRNKQGQSPLKKAQKSDDSRRHSSQEKAESPWDKATKRQASKASNNHASKSKAGRRKAHARDEAPAKSHARGSTAKPSAYASKKFSDHTRQPVRSVEQVVGIVSAHPDGFGFVDVAGREKGVFLPHEEMQRLMHGDEVEVRVVFKRGRESGEYIRTINEAASVLVGQFSLQDGLGLVKPRSRKMPQAILIKRGQSADAHDGDWVRIEIKRQSEPLEGKVLDVLGSDLTPQHLIDLVVAEQGLCASFDAQVLQESERIADEVQEQDCQGRMDLTHLPFVTIDGEDARDFDDAICVLPRGDGFEAWIAIADVAHYVQPSSALDIEAQDWQWWQEFALIPMVADVLRACMKR